MKRAAIALATVLATGCGAAVPRPASSVLPEWGPPQPGDVAPDLSLPSLRGGTVTLSSLRGHWVLVHFTASWCPFCDAEVAHLDEIAASRAKNGLAVLLVDEREPLERWTSYAQGKVSPPVEALYDRTGAAALPFAPPPAHPEFNERADAMFDSTLLIDPKGVIRMFLMPDSAHFDPTFPDIRAELARVYDGGAAAAPRAAGEEAEAKLDASRVVTVASSPLAVSPGAHDEIEITMRIAPGYHTMSDRPSKPEYIATAVAVAATSGLAFAPTVWPQATSFDLGGERIATFEHELSVRVPVDVDVGASLGPRPVHGTLRYQACTRTRCLFPATIPFETTIAVR